MAETRSVELPNGIVIPDVPIGATKEEIKEKAIRGGLATIEDFARADELPTSSALAEDARFRANAPEETFSEQAAPYVEAAIEGAAAVPPMAAAARGAQLLYRGSKASPYIADLARSLMPKTAGGLVTEGVIGAAGAVAGKAAGEQFPEGWQRNLAGMVGGATPGLVISPTRNLATMVTNRGAGQEGIEALGEGAKASGVIRAKRQAKVAFEANDALSSTLIQSGKIQEATGVSLPILAAANGDLTISGFIASQAAKGDNAGFTAAMRQQYETAEKQLTAFKQGKAPTMQEVDALVKQRAAAVKVKNEQFEIDFAARNAEAEKTVATLTDNIVEASSQLQVTGASDMGTRFTNMVKAKEATIRKSLSPLYKKVLESAETAGIKLPKENAQALVAFVNDEANKDVFSKFPALYRQIKTKWQAPTPVSSRIQTKYRIAKQPANAVANDVSVNDLDSLKRNVNKAINDTDDKDQLRMLFELKREVNKAIDSVDPAFSVPYKAIDQRYAQELGIPFNEQGILQVSRAKFVENTVPTLTSKTSSLKQALAVIGDDPDGIRLVEDAFITAIANNRAIVNTNTLEINPQQLKRWMVANKEKLDLVPSIQKRLDDLATGVTKIGDERTAILAAAKQDKVTYLADVLGEAFNTSGSIQGYINNVMKNPAKLDDMLARIDGDQTATDAVKATMLDILTSGGPNPLQWFDANIPAMAKVFGGDSIPALRYAVEASERLATNPATLKINPSTTGKSEFEEMTGSKFSQVIGELRNQIITKIRVVINTGSRYLQGKAARSEAEAMQDFLLDPDSLIKYGELVAEVETKGMTDRAIGIAKELFLKTSSTYAAGAIVGGYQAYSSDTPYQEYQPSDPSLLEGF